MFPTGQGSPKKHVSSLYFLKNQAFLRISRMVSSRPDAPVARINSLLNGELLTKRNCRKSFQ